MEKEEICIVLDVEFISNNILTKSLTQIGLVAIKKNCSTLELEGETWIIDRLSVCFSDQDKIKDESVMNFWSKFPEIYNRIQSEALSEVDGMRNVQVWLNNLYRNYNIVKYISDPACVDFQWFRSFYLEYCDQSLNEFPYLPFKCLCLDAIYDVLADVKCISKKDIIHFTETERYKHTHYALDDALKTAYEYLKLKQIFQLSNI